MKPEEALALFQRYEFDYKLTRLGAPYLVVNNIETGECIYVGTGPAIRFREYLDCMAADAGVPPLKFKLALSAAVGPEGWKL